MAKSFRVYFNPLSLKLEPIIFDAHSQNRFVVGLTSSLGKGFSQDWTNSGSADWFSLFWNTSGNERFIKSYIQTLKLISNKEWVDDFLSRNSAIINDSLATIYSDFPERDYVWNYGPAPYYWNDSFIYRQASWIQKQFQDRNIKYDVDEENNIYLINYSSLPANVELFCEGSSKVYERSVSSKHVNGPGVRIINNIKNCSNFKISVDGLSLKRVSSKLIFPDQPNYPINISKRLLVENDNKKLYITNTYPNDLVVNQIACNNLNYKVNHILRHQPVNSLFELAICKT